MADKSTQLILEALARAAAEPAGVPLHGGKTSPGLFPTSPLGKQAARRCKDEGWLRVVRTAPRGKAVQEICALTDGGLAYLANQASPKQVLEDLVRILEARHGQVNDLLSTARQACAGIEALRAAAEPVLRQLHPTAPDPAPLEAGAILDHLSAWQQSRASEDCPLPELYYRAGQAVPGLTIGRFHDRLRALHDQERIYLHPWTGPLHALPEPPYALLVGHEIAYYASRRCA